MRLLAVVLALAAPASAAAPDLSVTTAFTPATVHYGDPVTAVAEVHYDPDSVDGSSIRAVPTLTPFVLVAKPVVQQAGNGTLRIRYSLLCVTEGCLPVGASKVLHLRPLTVTALAGGRRLSATAAWPALRIDSRLRPSDLRGEAPFRSPAAPPKPHYRVAPAALVAAAVICVLGAIALVVAALLRWRRRPVTRRVSPLELAIAYVRDSARRPDPDRRRALELLSEAVDEELALTAADAAWSRQPPTPEGAGDLADRAEGRS